MLLGRGSGVNNVKKEGHRCALHHPYPWVFCTLHSFGRIKRPSLSTSTIDIYNPQGKIGDSEESNWAVHSTSFQEKNALVPEPIWHIM